METLQDPNGLVDAWHLDELSREFPQSNYDSLCNILKISFNEGQNILREVHLNSQRAVRQVLEIWQNNSENGASRAKLATVLRSARSQGLIRILNRPLPIEDPPSTHETSSPRSSDSPSTHETSSPRSSDSPSTHETSSPRSSDSSSTHETSSPRSSDERRQSRINQDSSTNSFTNSGTVTAKDIKVGPQMSITNFNNAPETHHHHHHDRRPQIVTQRVPVFIQPLKRKTENWSQPGSSTKKQRTQNDRKVVSQSAPSTKSKKRKKNPDKTAHTKSKAGTQTTRPAKNAKTPKKTKVASQPGPSVKSKNQSKKPAKITPSKSRKTTHPAKKSKTQKKPTHKVARPAINKKPKKIKKQQSAKRATGSKKKTGRR